MPAIDTSTIVIAIGVVAGVVMLLTVFTVLSRFYRRCGADEALVRTGSGGNKVVIGGGVLVYPILHQLLRVSLRSVKLSVERSAKNALVTADKIKANVTTELYIKVEPIAEDVLAAARSFGERNLDEHAIGDLIEGKLTDALRSVAANQTFMALHAKRKQFAEHIQAALSRGAEEERPHARERVHHRVRDGAGQGSRPAGRVRRRRSPRHHRERADEPREDQPDPAREGQPDPGAERRRAQEAARDGAGSEAGRGRSGAQGRRVLGDASGRDRQGRLHPGAGARSRVAREATRGRDAPQEQRRCMRQAARREAYRAEKGRQAPRSQASRIEAAKIDKDKAVQAAEIDRQKALEAATIDKEKAVEVARIGKQIAITQSEEQEARAQAAKALALADEEKAKQAIVTVETTAKAEREKAIQVIAAQAEAEVRRAQAEATATVAEKEAEATVLRANASAHLGEVEAQVRRKLLDAENAISARVVMRDILLKALDIAPEVTRELMSPAKAISEIKVLQTNGMGGQQGVAASGTAPALGAMSPVLKTILEAGAAYPLMRELMSFAQVDHNKIGEKAKAAIGELTNELQIISVEEKEPQTNRNGKSAEMSHVQRSDAE